MKRQKNNATIRTANKLKKTDNKNVDSQINKNMNKRKKIPKYEKSISKVKNGMSNKQQNSNFVKEKKPNWLEYKKQQKQLREKRKAKKLEDLYNVTIQAKQIGEKLRRTQLSPCIKEKLTKNLFDLIQNQYGKLIFSHDMSRIIQWQIKYCNANIELEIMQKLKPYLHEMFFFKYAKNIIRAFLKKGSNNITKIVLQQCNGHVVKLLNNVISAPLFEKIYVEVASPTEKNIFKQEFYSDLFKNCKDANIKTLTDTYKNAKDMKMAILSSVKTNLIKILNKNLINSTLIHTVLYEYLSNCSKEDRAEIIVMIRTLITELSQTKDGVKAANLCIWHGTNKDRKLIMKALKEHIKDILTSEQGHLIILALLDSVDDTILLKKIILQEMLNNLNEIVTNEYGKRVILYLVARRDTHYFHPTLIEYLKEGDGNAASKKPSEIRENELLNSVIDNLLESIITDIKTWLSKGAIQLVTLAILKACSGDKPKLAFDAIAKFITNSNSKLENETQTFEVIEEPGLHLMLKKLIQMDSERVKKNELTFGEVLFEHLNTEVFQHWINYNRGCFLLISLMTNESEKIISKLKSKLQKIQSLKLKKSVGASILLTKLN